MAAVTIETGQEPFVVLAKPDEAVVRTLAHLKRGGEIATLAAALEMLINKAGEYEEIFPYTAKSAVGCIQTALSMLATPNTQEPAR